MKLLLLLASSFIAVQAFFIPDNDMEEWKAYKMEYKKSYSEEEDKFRMKVFMDNKREIEEHNARYEKGEVTFTLGLNQFSDMLHSEFVAKYNGTRRSNIRGTFKWTQASIFIPPAHVEIPDEVNWVEKGAVTPAPIEGECYASYAFSATGSVEGQHFLKTRKLVSLSAQNLVDCSKGYYNFGCIGGTNHFSFDYIKQNKGINTEESYPYTGKEGKCKFNRENIGATIKSYKMVKRYNETALQIAVATIGPISVGLDAMDHESFTHYKGGVYSEPDCSSYAWDRFLLLVGYGTDKETNQKYWLVRNSWGEDWGEKGYMRIARDANNMCAIASAGFFPVV